MYCYCFCFTEIAELQRLNKESLLRVWRHYLSNDWIPHEKASSFPVDRFYSDLMSGGGKLTQKFHDIYDVVNITGQGNTRILLIGEIILAV